MVSNKTFHLLLIKSTKDVIQCKHIDFANVRHLVTVYRYVLACCRCIHFRLLPKLRPNYCDWVISVLIFAWRNKATLICLPKD